MSKETNLWYLSTRWKANHRSVDVLAFVWQRITRSSAVPDLKNVNRHAIIKIRLHQESTTCVHRMWMAFCLFNFLLFSPHTPRKGSPKLPKKHEKPTFIATQTKGNSKAQGKNDLFMQMKLLEFVRSRINKTIKLLAPLQWVIWPLEQESGWPASSKTRRQLNQDNLLILSVDLAVMFDVNKNSLTPPPTPGHRSPWPLMAELARTAYCLPASWTPDLEWLFWDFREGKGPGEFCFHFCL